jgi:hypothetical protein
MKNIWFLSKKHAMQVQDPNLPRNNCRTGRQQNATHDCTVLARLGSMRAAWRMETAPRSKNREKRHASALLSNNGLRAEGGGVPIDVSRARARRPSFARRAPRRQVTRSRDSDRTWGRPRFGGEARSGGGRTKKLGRTA